MSDSDWSTRIAQYRTEEPITTILATITRPQFVLDETIHKELQGYFLFLGKQDAKPRTVVGPGDYPTLLQILDDLHPVKDRLSEVILVFGRIKNDVARMMDVVRSYLLLKPEVANSKNDAVRQAIVVQTVPEVESVLSRVKAIIESAEVVLKCCNQTYNFAHTQSDVLKQIVYWRSLTNPTDAQSAGKIRNQL